MMQDFHSFVASYTFFQLQCFIICAKSEKDRLTKLCLTTISFITKKNKQNKNQKKTQLLSNSCQKFLNFFSIKTTVQGSLSHQRMQVTLVQVHFSLPSAQHKFHLHESKLEIISSNQPQSTSCVGRECSLKYLIVIPNHSTES